jgi:hypothetical protein
MKKFKVDYVGYDTMEYGVITRTEIVEAKDTQEAKDKIESRSCMGGYDYYVQRIEEVNE